MARITAKGTCGRCGGQLIYELAENGPLESTYCPHCGEYVVRKEKRKHRTKTKFACGHTYVKEREVWEWPGEVQQPSTYVEKVVCPCPMCEAKNAWEEAARIEAEKNQEYQREKRRWMEFEEE